MEFMREHGEFVPEDSGVEAERSGVFFSFI
jgi:hypothetical protein